MTHHPLWRRIRRYVTTGRETAKVDLKRTLDLSSKSQKAEFAKDVTAIANTPGGDGFLILGVRDLKDRPGAEPADAIAGFAAEQGADIFHRQMIEALTQFCNRVPTVEYDEIAHPDVDRPIGVITIRRSTHRPHSLIRSSGDVEQNQIWIRRGSGSYSASVAEIEEMWGRSTPLTPSLIINLSGHPLSGEQREQIQDQGVYIEEEIHYPLHFRAPPIQPQIETAVAQIGLTSDEWQTRALILLLPGLAPAAAALLATVHGLRGGFPRVLWIGPHPSDASRYVVNQLIPLQAMRDDAREVRVGDIG